MKKLAYIDDTAFPIVEGESILEFIKRHKGADFIPTLCNSANLSAGGACRLCSVEVSSSQNKPTQTIASCHTNIFPGAHIFPNTERIQTLRKNIVELVLSDYPVDNIAQIKNENSELQSVVEQVGINEIRYSNGKKSNTFKKDTSHPYLTSDMNKCINCGLCVQSCDEIQGEMILSMAGRGFDSHVIKGMDTSFELSDCVSCGACAQVCPTDAISDIFQPNAHKADTVTRTTCTYCGVGCNLEVSTDNNEILNITAPFDSEVNPGHACVKGRYAFQFYNHPDRLRQPHIRKNGKLEPATWQEAYTFIADKLNEIKKDHGPDKIAGISSARCTNEENYLMQKFVRAVIGTNNIDGCARICHAPTAVGMQRAFGTGAATNSINDINHTDCMMIVGANPTYAHPVTGAKIKQAVIKGKTLIVIDPRKTELARYATYHLALRPGTNIALLNMMLYFIIEAGLMDQSFINSRCEGFDEFKNQIKLLDVDEMAHICQVDQQLVKEAALAYASAQSAMCFHGLGVTEHLQGTFGVELIANLAMITGNIGRPGTGVNPLRGQNNVQGAADMGVQPNQGPGYFNMDDDQKRKIYEDAYGVSMPSGPGLTMPRMFEAAMNGDIKALWIIGEDVAQTEASCDKVTASLRNLDLLVVQELFMSATAELAHVVLPASSFFEKDGTFTNGERRVQRVNQVIQPLEGTKPDGQIIIDIMNHMGYKQPGYHPEWILEEISNIVPFFEGVQWSTLGDTGKQWPVSADGSDTQILHQETFKIGKGKFHFNNFQETPEILDHSDNFPFILTTNRSLAHYNSGSMTRRTREVLIESEDWLLINQADAQKKKLSNEDMVKISSDRGSTNIRIKISDEVRPGILSSTFHFPQVLINRITSEVMDTETDCPEFKVVAVDIEKV